MNLALKQKNEKFESFLESIVFDEVTSELTPEKRTKRLRSVANNEFAFCKTYYSQIFSLPFNEMQKRMRNAKKGNYTFSGFRKCGKSAYAYIAKVVKRICEQKGGVVNISARTIDVANEKAASIYRIIKNNRKLCYDFNLEFIQSEKGYYIIGNTILMSSSVKQGLRNITDDNFTRIVLSINDDLYNKNTVTSEADNQKVQDFVESEVYGQLEDEGLCITLGNSINPDCPIVRLKNSNPTNHFSLPALDENGESTWKRYKTTEQWNKFSKTIPHAIWQGEYLDETMELGEVFKEEHFRFVNVNTLTRIATISSADPARGQSPSACFKALTTMSLMSNDEFVVEDVYCRHENYLHFFDYVDAIRTKFAESWKVCTFENDFQQWDFAERYYQDWTKSRGKVLPFYLILSRNLKTQFFGSDKISRIMNLVHPHQTGKLLYSKILKGSRDFEIYKSQLFAFPNSKEKMDGPDSAATAFIILPSYKPSEGGIFKSLKQRTWKKKGRLFG